jgi:hypothetical protein
MGGSFLPLGVQSVAPVAADAARKWGKRRWHDHCEFSSDVEGAMKSIVLVAFPVALAAAGCQRDPGLSAPEVPEAIEAPADQRLLFHAAAVGVQIYACTAKEGGYEWVLKAPDADLLGPRGEKLGTHYAGPTWEASDGSKVVGALKAKADAPDANAVPWLLLESKQNEGNGAFAAVKSVQRVDTRGGKAPATGCDAAHLGTEIRVGYEATYYFYGGER